MKKIHTPHEEEKKFFVQDENNRPHHFSNIVNPFSYFSIYPCDHPSTHSPSANQLLKDSNNQLFNYRTVIIADQDQQS